MISLICDNKENWVKPVKCLCLFVLRRKIFFLVWKRVKMCISGDFLFHVGNRVRAAKAQASTVSLTRLSIFTQSHANPHMSHSENHKLPLFNFSPSYIFTRYLLAILGPLFCLWLVYPDDNPNQSSDWKWYQWPSSSLNNLWH